MPLARLYPGLQREGQPAPAVRPGLPWQSPPTLNKNQGLKGTPTLGVSEPFRHILFGLSYGLLCNENNYSLFIICFEVKFIILMAITTSVFMPILG